MAKRKRKRGRTGVRNQEPAHPGAGKKPAGATPDLAERLREKDRFMALVSKEMGKQNFDSPEEAQAFLNAHFTGRPMGEILAEHRQPESPQEEALAIVDAVAPGCPLAKARNEFRRALEIDPDCIEALLGLASLERKPGKAAVFLKKAVEIGRRKFAGLIETVTPDHGLWGFHEARPFLNALFNLAATLEGQRKFEEAIGAYREILRLNHGDNQGVRYDLVTLLLVLNENAAALELIDEYPDEPSCHWLFSGALAQFRRTAEASDFNFEPGSAEEAANIDALVARLRELPGEFAAANRALDAALEAYPFASLFLAADDEALQEIEEPWSFRHGSPDEVFLYARSQGFLWSEDPILTCWLVVRMEPLARTRAWRDTMKKNADELADYGRILGWGEGRHG